MFDFLPEKHDKKWFVLALIYSVVVFASIYLCSQFLLSSGLDPKEVPGIAIVSVAISFIICLFGFFNARWLFICSSGGLFLAICMMIMIFLEEGKTGWEDVIGVISFYLMVLLGIGVGIVAELIAFVMRRLGKGGQNRNRLG